MIASVPLPLRRARLALASAALFAACNGGPTALDDPSLLLAAPFVTGEVARLPQPDDDWGYLVLGTPQANGDPNGAYFHLDRAEIRWSDGERASVADVMLGRRASVWATPGSPVLLSLPPRISARLVVLERL